MLAVHAFKLRLAKANSIAERQNDFASVFLVAPCPAQIYAGPNMPRKIAKPANPPLIEKVSAGLLMFRLCDGVLQVLLVHPGGPFWQHKENGAWSIPKGGINAGEDPLEAARREFQEETGFACEGPFIPLKSIKQKSGKTVLAWAFQGDCDPARVRSINFEMEWPPYSGVKRSFPEVDRAAFFHLAEAKRKIIPAQAAFIAELLEKLQGKP
jgi:predicted NUDIX family NTP pyrophosphohydrolase